MPTNTKIITSILRRHGPLTTHQILKFYPEAENTWKLKWEILHHLRRNGIITIKQFKEASPTTASSPSSSVASDKQIFLWTLPREHNKSLISEAGKKIVRE